jgi:hypothetical protein
MDGQDPAESRRFVVSTGRMQLWVRVCTYGTLLAFVAVFAVMFADRSVRPIGWAVLAVLGVAATLMGVFCARRWGWSKTIPIHVTTEALTVERKSGEIFSFTGATLGRWAAGQPFAVSGTALHLPGGRDGFVLGGKDHRLSAATRFGAPATAHVDGWLEPAEFDEVLTIAARRSGLDVRRPAPDDPLRCLLFPRPSTAGFMSAARNYGRELQPRFALDVGKDAVRVIDPNTDALLASASLTRVTATPAIYRETKTEARSTWSILVLSVPGLERLTIKSPRAWRSAVSEEKTEPKFIVSEADWQVLVDRFGLAARLVERR